MKGRGRGGVKRGEDKNDGRGEAKGPARWQCACDGEVAPGYRGEGRGRGKTCARILRECVPLAIYTAQRLVRTERAWVDVARAPCVCRVCEATRLRPMVGVLCVSLTRALGSGARLGRLGVVGDETAVKRTRAATLRPVCTRAGAACCETLRCGTSSVRDRE